MENLIPLSSWGHEDGVAWIYYQYQVKLNNKKKWENTLSV